MAKSVTKQEFICKPDHVLAAIEARTGLRLAKGTLKSWRKERPLDLPCIWEEFDDWLAAVLKARRNRRESVRVRRQQFKTESRESGKRTA